MKKDPTTTGPIMDVPLKAIVQQPSLLEITPPETESIGFQPAVWEAVQALVSPELVDRQKGLEKLRSLGAARSCALVGYVLATRLLESDLSLRAQIIRLMADVFSPDQEGMLSSEDVYQNLSSHLAQIGEIYLRALLEAVEFDPSLEGAVGQLLGYSALAGAYLAQILADRSESLFVRRLAVRFIRQVGYMEALPTLERLSGRLEARLNGQKALFELPETQSEELSLLSELQEAIKILRAP